jgi:hypothetical protein
MTAPNHAYCFEVLDSACARGRVDDANIALLGHRQKLSGCDKLGVYDPAGVM